MCFGYKEKEDMQLSRKGLGVGKLVSSKAIIYLKRNSAFFLFYHPAHDLDIKYANHRQGWGRGTLLSRFPKRRHLQALLHRASCHKWGTNGGRRAIHFSHDLYVGNLKTFPPFLNYS